MLKPVTVHPNVKCSWARISMASPHTLVHSIVDTVDGTIIGRLLSRVSEDQRGSISEA
jgi:hypothetical protein